MGMLGVDMFVSKLMDRLNVEGGCWLEVCVKEEGEYRSSPSSISVGWLKGCAC